MRKRFLLLLIAFLTLGTLSAYAQMSDEQIVSYITEGLASGKTERQLGTELMAKGVTTSQLQRLFKAYKNGSLNMADTNVMPSNKLGETSKDRRSSSVEEEDPFFQSDKMKGKKGKQGKQGKQSKDEYSEDEEMDMELEEPDVEEEPRSPLFDEDGNKIIYGHNMFSAEMLSFEPNITSSPAPST